jgi:membrane-associated PAP2 superfamily phosphatase
VTGVYCPCEIERYGGEMPYVRLFETVPPEIVAVKRGRCFPAAHASGGFALMAFAFAGARRLRNAWWGLGWGWILGLYQMARGVHYLSHTVVSMLVAWVLILLIARLFRLDPMLRTSSGS